MSITLEHFLYRYFPKYLGNNTSFDLFITRECAWRKYALQLYWWCLHLYMLMLNICLCVRVRIVCVLVCMLTFVDHALCLLAYCAYCTVTHAPVPVYFVLPTIFVSFDPNDLVEFKDQNMGRNSMMMGRLWPNISCMQGDVLETAFVAITNGLAVPNT